MVMHHGHGEAVHHALPITGKVKGGKHPTPQDGKRSHVGTATPIETGALGLVREEVTMPRPVTDVLGFTL